MKNQKRRIDDLSDSTEVILWAIVIIFFFVLIRLAIMVY